MKTLASIVGVVAIGLFSLTPMVVAADEKAEMVTVKGEILDLNCYTDHGAQGDKHAKCAATCIESGLPVGIKGEDGKVYLVVGDHKPMNKELSPFAGKVVTLKGKTVTRDGINLLENAELVK